MGSILLAPHADDETLFAAYTCLRERPHVIVCTSRPDSQGELPSALKVLGCSGFDELVFAEGALNSQSLKRWLELNNEFGSEDDPDVVWAPAYERHGHAEHNMVALAATDVFGAQVRSYLTYAPRGQRSREGVEVEPEPWMISAKLEALSCYRSQIKNPQTRPWFFDLLDMREWVTTTT